jgi:alkylhydroperoxidase family enzyme
MARLTYPEERDHPELADLIAQIRAQRGGRLANLYKMLLKSPPVAAGWLHLLTAVRQQTQLPGQYRELAILRVAVINGAEYEYRAHVPFGLKEGLNQGQIDALPTWQNSELLDSRQKAVLAYTDAMTREVHVPDNIFAGVRGHFNDREIVELTATIAAYNLVSRFLEALQIDSEK